MKIAEHLNKTVFAKLGVSPIHGVGVFAIRDIPKGQIVTDYSYQFHRPEDGLPVWEISESEFDEVLPEIQALILDRYAFDEAQQGSLLKFMSPNYDQNLQSFMNHSDEPNVNELVAVRDIKKGEEITENFRDLFISPHKLTKKHYHFLWQD